MMEELDKDLIKELEKYLFQEERGLFRLRDIMAQPKKIKAFFIVTGPYASGKSSFLRTLAEGGLLEVDISDYFDYAVTGTLGIITVSPNEEILLLESPGARRVDTLIAGFGKIPVGTFILLDSRKPETFREAKSIVQICKVNHKMPYLLLANYPNDKDAWTEAELERALHEDKVLNCDALSLKDTRQALLQLLDKFLDLVPLAEELQKRFDSV